MNDTDSWHSWSHYVFVTQQALYLSIMEVSFCGSSISRIDESIMQLFPQVFAEIFI